MAITAKNIGITLNPEALSLAGFGLFLKLPIKEGLAAMELSIGLLEDDALTRVAIAESLKNRGYRVGISASSASEFIDSFGKVPLDAVLLDLHLGDGPTGLDVGNFLRSKSSILGIVFLTSFEDPRLLNSGIRDFPIGSRYLTKKSIGNLDALDEEIRSSIKRAKKNAVLGESALMKLTDSQIETLRLVAEGLSNSEIAKARFVTEKTVESTIARITKALELDASPGRNARVHMAQVYFRSRGVEVTTHGS